MIIGGKSFYEIFDNNYKERLLKYCFEDNWIEPPIYYNNKTKTLCFHLESKSEIYCATMISNVFDDVFYSDSKMFVAFMVINPMIINIT